ncbi:MAG: hypothetical protein HY744_12870, partial [Deltaproteobacteria bacterium]|nr:hypothetical protein [Deltaproteobacteria bacterium]
MAYGVEAPWPPDTPGASIELLSPADDNAAGASWAPAIATYGDGDRGTPGGPNGAPPGSYTIDGSVVGWHQPALKASLRFAPHHELESHVLTELAAAKKTARLAFFNIRLPAVKTKLISLVKSGVDVHVLLDKKQQDLAYNTMAEELQKAGVPVTLIENTLAADATLHDKFTVIDGHRVLTGSANYSQTALNVSDEDLLTFDDPSLAGRYLAEWDELVAKGAQPSPAYPPSAKIRAFMGPEDDLVDIITAELDQAKTHVLCAMFDLGTEPIVDALVAAKDRGVKVVAVLDEVQATEPDATTDETLKGAGIPVVLAHNTGSKSAEMHSKFAVIDHQRLVMGSANWTNLGMFFNDENLLVIADAHLAARAEGKLAELLQTYNAPSAKSLGLTTGAQQVKLEVTNVSLNPGVTLAIQSYGGGPFAVPAALQGTALAASIEAGTNIEYC